MDGAVGLSVGTSGGQWAVKKYLGGSSCRGHLLTGDNPVIEISFRDKPGVHALLAEQLHDDMTGRGACYKFAHTAS